MIAVTGGMYKIRILCTGGSVCIIRRPQEGSGTKRTSAAAPQVLYSYYGPLARRSIGRKAMTYRQCFRTVIAEIITGCGQMRMNSRHLCQKYCTHRKGEYCRNYPANTVRVPMAPGAQKV
jgi:hypothetical protein